MRPLYHPAIQDVTVEGLLYALSDPVRVQIFAEIQGASCPKTCSTFLTLKNRTLPKSTLSQHFKILRESGLIRSERKGVEMHSTSRCGELKARFGPMIQAIVEAYCLNGQKGSTTKGAKIAKKKATK
jgi:DNA-binding transcriptional ArsR family regulator